MAGKNTRPGIHQNPLIALILHNFTQKHLMTKQKNSDSQHAKETQEEQVPDKKNENLPIGKLLRQLREKKTLTVHDISRETKISSSNLTSIELGNYNELPADTFIRGQINIYADFLGLDGTEAARLFFEERTHCLTEGERKSKSFSQQGLGLSTKELAEPALISSAVWAISLLVLIITFLALFSWYTGWNPFAYFPEQQPTQVSTTDMAQPAQPDQEAEEESSFLPGTTPEQSEGPVSIAPPLEPTQPVEETDEVADKPVEQNTTPE